jgi:CubicO group peptidase (beta-lactamase class C family)
LPHVYKIRRGSKYLLREVPVTAAIESQALRAFLLALILVAPAHPQRSRDKIDDYIRGEMNARQVPGLAFAVLDGSHVLRKGAYGLANVETNSPVESDSVFELASVTKPITGVAVMMLVQEGRVGLDESIDKYLPDAPQAWRQITIRELLSHTSGLREYGLVRCNGSELLDISTKQQFEDLVKSSLLFPPGTGVQYSDPGYFLLGMVIEKASGQKYGDFLQTRIFTPVGMSHTSLLNRSAIIPKRVSSYTFREGHLNNARRAWQHELPSWFGIWSTVDDLVRFDVALSSGGLIRPETLEQMWRPATLKNNQTVMIDQMPYGLGWFVGNAAGHRVVAHPGWTGTFYLKYPDDRVSIILLSNLDAGSGSAHTKIAQGILGLLRPDLPRFLPEQN